METVDKSIYELRDKSRKDKENFFPPYLQKYIDKIIENTGYIKYSVNKRQLKTDGGNYLGVLYEVDINGNTADGDKKDNIFIKNTLPSDVNQINKAYDHESFAYNELSNIFTELQNEANVPLHDRYKMATSYVSNSEVIILENLTNKGFKTYHRMDVVPLKFAELAVQQLAKFHGLSFVLQTLNPSYADSKIKTLKPIFNFNDDKFTGFIKNFSEMTCKSLDYFSKKKMDKFLVKICDKFYQYLGDTTSVGCCLSHGDFRANNILSREINGEITEVIPVDYQFIHFSSPVHDLLYLLFTGTDQEFRRRHLIDLKNMYYDTLEKFLQYFDLDVKYIYPRNEFEKQFTERLDYGLMVAMYVLPICFVTDDDVPDMGKEELTTINFKLDIRHEERIQGIVDDFIKWGYI